MPLIESLQNRTLYDPVPAEVRVVETHMSWVLLAAPFAYKIKKPVDLGFADFRTLAKRRYFCQEEVRVNQRLAPQLYLSVVPISGSAEAPVISGSGLPIEYAVKMLQFPQSALFRQMLDEGRLFPTNIDQLSRTIATFHQRIARSSPQDRFGTPEAIRGPVEANFHELAELVPDEGQLVSVQTAAEWSRQEHALRGSEFAARKEAGLVRECHGDVHLRNIVFLDGEVLLFDCIEFNEDLRWTDVLNDLAFPMMDLEHRLRGDLAYRLLNAYLELTGDYAGLAVLRYYLVYRALVRAKVAAIRARQEERDAEHQQRLWSRVSAYLNLSARYTCPPKPILLITHGYAGSGKTSGTQVIVEHRCAVRIRSDVERKRLLGLGPQATSDSRPDRGIYSTEMNGQTYSHLADQAASVLRAGFSVVVDAAFLRRGDRDRFRRLAAQCGVPFVMLDFQARIETLRRRLPLRQGDASEADRKVLDYQLATHEPLGEDEHSDVLTVDAEAPPATDALLAALDPET